MAHHLLTVSGVVQTEPLMEEMMVPDAHGDDEHGHGQGHADVEAQNSISANEDCESNDTHARSGCGTCASCCIGAYAPPPVVALTAAEEVAISVQQFLPSSFIGHIPPRIERPPRTSDFIVS
ncbi:hypothetical protein [Massilia niastensis]|uniref:hypothetical protein n=1 Tax=Massilia niastensis TaxID=544911 RepID=UPI0012EC6D42|nr:hypothetical protein [Massilia niastensis]